MRLPHWIAQNFVITERAAHQRITRTIHTVIAAVVWCNNIANRFGHLLPLQPTTRWYTPFWAIQYPPPSGRSPVYGMKPCNFLTHHMRVCRPEFLKQVVIITAIAKCADIVSQRINPDIHDMLVIVRHRHAPIKGCARNRQIFKPDLTKLQFQIGRFHPIKFGFSL